MFRNKLCDPADELLGFFPGSIRDVLVGRTWIAATPLDAHAAFTKLVRLDGTPSDPGRIKVERDGNTVRLWPHWASGGAADPYLLTEASMCGDSNGLRLTIREGPPMFWIGVFGVLLFIDIVFVVFILTSVVTSGIASDDLALLQLFMIVFSVATTATFWWYIRAVKARTMKSAFQLVIDVLDVDVQEVHTSPRRA